MKDCSVSNYTKEFSSRVTSAKELETLESAIVQYLNEKNGSQEGLNVGDAATALTMIANNPLMRRLIISKGSLLYRNWLSPEHAASWIKGKLNPGESHPQDDLSKIDSLDTNTEAEDIKRVQSGFLMKTYGGNSSAKRDLLRRFDKFANQMFFVRLDGGGEISTQEDLEANIIRATNQIYESLRNAAIARKLPGAESLPRVLVTTKERETIKNWNAFLKTAKGWSQIFDTDPAALSDMVIAAHKDPDLHNALEIFQDTFMLEHLDDLIAIKFEKTFKITQGAGEFTGVTYKGVHKYQKIDQNQKLRTSWTSNDEEQTNALAETSEHLRAFFDSMTIESVDSDVPPRSTSMQEIANTWVAIKSKIRENSQPILLTGDPTVLREYFTPRERKLLKEQKLPGEKDPSLQALLSASSGDPELMRLLIKALGCNSETPIYDLQGFTTLQKSVFYSLYNSIFAEDSPIYKSFITNQTRSTIGKAPKNYYEWFPDFFGNLSKIDMNQLVKDTNGDVRVVTLGDNGVNTGVYEFLSKRASAFSGVTDYKKDADKFEKVGRTFSFSPTSLTKENQELTIELANGIKISRTGTGAVTVTDSSGKTYKPQNISDKSPLYQPLQDFYMEVLGFSYYVPKLVSAALGAFGVQLPKLLDLATDILYNYSVSYQLAGRTLSKKQYIEKAKAFYGSEVGKYLKMQKGDTELEIATKNNMGITDALIKAKDFLEGRIRDAVVKSADGTNINVISTSQIAYSAYDQWMREAKQPNYACAGFSLRSAYKGIEFARDTKWGPDSSKRVSAFSEAEMFGRNFMAGYLVPQYSPSETAGIQSVYRIVPMVVSDKVRIPEILIDMDAYNAVIGKTWRDCTVDDIQKTIKVELGDYYNKVYKEFTSRFTALHDAFRAQPARVSSYGSDTANADVDFYLSRLAASTDKDLGFTSSFATLNQITQEFKAAKLAEFNTFFNAPEVSFGRGSAYFEDFREFALEQTSKLGMGIDAIRVALETKSNPKVVEEFSKFINDKITDRAKNAFSNIIHDLTVKAKRLGKNVTLPANSSYVFGDDGRVYINPVLVDQLYRWGTLSARKAQSLLPFYYDKALKQTVQLQLSSGEGNAASFFKTKTIQTLKNILQDDGSVVITGDALKEAGKKTFTPEGTDVKIPFRFYGKYVLGAITYQGRDDEGKIVTFTENLTDRTSFENSFILGQAFAYKKYIEGDDSFKFASASEWFQSTAFKFSDFEEAAAEALRRRERLIHNEEDFEADWERRRKGLYDKLTDEKDAHLAELDKRIAELEAKQKTLTQERDIRENEQRIAYLEQQKNTYPDTQDTYINGRLEELEKAKQEEKDKFGKIKSGSERIADDIIKVQVHVNPDLAKFNALSFLFGQEYTIATLGSHINHPGMKSIAQGLSAIEALCFQQQTKRNVSLTATKNKYHLNRWNGLRDHHKICLISNVKDAVYNITGTQDEVFNDDGACYTTGVTHYWENASLGSNAVGIDKKTFFHAHDAGLGTGYIGKDAGFTGNNDRIRSSLFYAYLNYRALSDQDGELAQYMQNGGLDITHRYNIMRTLETDPQTKETKYVTTYGNEPIAFSDFTYEKVIIRDKFGEEVPQLNADFGPNWASIPEHAVIKVLGDSITFDEKTGLTNFTAKVYVDGNGSTVQLSTQIKNVHDIWKFFGGAYSGTMSADGTISPEHYNDLSTQYTAEVCNLVGERINGTKFGDLVSSQSQVNQFLKNSVIVYMPTVESVKQGATNVNDVTQLDNFDYVMTSMDLDLHDSGVQLNAEHHADDTVISMMTQVLNALGARGYTANEGDRTYQALRALTETNLKNYIDTIRHRVTGEVPSEEMKNKLTNFIAQIITKTIRSADLDDGTLVAALTFQARNAMEHKSGNLNYEEIMQYIPIDDLGILRSEMSKISSELVKSCIKVKFPGSMDVLSPSNGRFLLYDGKMLDQYKGNLKRMFDKDKEAQTTARQEVNRSTHDIRLGTTYKLSAIDESVETKLDNFLLGTLNADGTIDVKINTPTEYWAVQDYLARNPNVCISEVYSAGRDLAAYGVTFATTDAVPEHYQIWDLAIIQDLYNRTLTGTKEQKREALIKLQATLSSLSSDPNFTKVDVRYFNAAEQKWETKSVEVDKKSINVNPYEVIMSMHDQEQFGLRVGDDVRTISEDKLFFLRRFVKDNFKGEGDNDRYFDFEIRSMDKKNKIWISLTDKPVDREYFTLVSNKVFVDSSDPNNITYWQVDFSGNKVRRLSSENDKIYRGAAGETLIVTDSPSFFIDSNNHASLTVSTRVAERDADTILNIFTNQLMKCESPNVKNFIKRFKMRLDGMTEEQVDEDAVDTSNFVEELGKSKDVVANELKGFITAGRESFTRALKYVEDVLDEPLQPGEDPSAKLSKLVGKVDGKYQVPDGRVRDMIANTLEIHTSFLKSLEVLAARIPAQCMQSFMAMKIVGFDRSGVNTAYVSRFQIYLQGSDFDIDKVSLLGFKFRNGKFVTWSPFMDISSIENLEASLNIPFPTGREFTAVEDSTKRCSLGDNILYGLTPTVKETEDHELSYVMLGKSGNVLYELVPQKEIDPRFNELPTKPEILKAFRDLSELSGDALSATLQVFAQDGYQVDGVTLKVSDLIPEDLREEIDGNSEVNLNKLKSRILENLDTTISEYTGSSQIKGYRLVLGDGEIDDVTKQAIQRSIAYITKSGQTLTVDETGGNILKEYGFDVTEEQAADGTTIGRATRSDVNISAAKDFLNFVLAHPNLFTYKSGKFILNTGVNYKGNKEQLLEDLGTFIQAVNEFEGIPQFNEPASKQEIAFNNSIEDILKEINKHNLSLSKNSRNLQDALINFISTSMYGVSKNPINQIQAQSSVDASDGAVKRTKDMAKQSEYSKKLIEFNPGSITSLYRMTKLTLGGKTNVGITASSLKTFEGLTQYTYNVLNHGTTDRISALLTDRIFVGHHVQMIANPYQQNKQNFLPFDVYLALQNVAARSDFDAYLWYSGILSLSTDNAKDPTTVKINAGEKMLGLYLAGLAVGVEMEALIPIMTSPAGILINSLMEANIYTGNPGIFDVKSVINYIDKQSSFLQKLSDSTLEIVYDNYAAAQVAGTKTKQTPYTRKAALNDQKFIKYFMSRATKQIQDYAKKNPGDKADKALRDLRAFRKYKSTVDTITNCTITYEGNEYYPYQEIKKLNAVLEEMRIFSQIGRLNQTLPNTIADQLVWRNKFEHAIQDRINNMSAKEKNSRPVKEAQEKLKELNTKIGMQGGWLGQRIDFMEFVENEEYRRGVIEAYDAMKVVVNPYAAMSELAHYFGYMQTLAGLFRVNESSNIYKTTEYITKHIAPLTGTPEQKTAQVTRIIDWINDNLISGFLRKAVAPIKINVPEEAKFEVYTKGNALQLPRKPLTSSNSTIVLGSEEGNATFKVLMEEIVIPRLQEEHPENTLLTGLTPTKFDKTSDKNFIIKTATETSGAPHAEFEQENLTKYKAGLHALRKEAIPELNGMSAVDALFIYNLIVNSGKVGQTTLSMVFEDYAVSQGRNIPEFAGYGSSIIEAYYDSRRLQESELLEEISKLTGPAKRKLEMSMAVIDYDFTTKAKYIIHKNPETRKFEILYNKRVADAQQANQDQENSQLEDMINESGGDLEEGQSDVDLDAVGGNAGEQEEDYAKTLSDHGLIVVGRLNNGKLARALLAPAKITDAELVAKLYENPMTGEIRIRQNGRLLKFRDLVARMTDKARADIEKAGITSIKELLEEKGLIKPNSTTKIEPTEKFGMIDDLYKYLTEEQC